MVGSFPSSERVGVQRGDRRTGRSFSVRFGEASVLGGRSDYRLSFYPESELCKHGYGLLLVYLASSRALPIREIRFVPIAGFIDPGLETNDRATGFGAWCEAGRAPEGRALRSSGDDDPDGGKPRQRFGGRSSA
jgi:hypothetical protein